MQLPYVLEGTPFTKEMLQNPLVIDVETTGLDPTYDQIIEIATCPMWASDEHVECSLIRPQRSVSAAAYVVHQIANVDLVCAPSFEEYWPKLQEIIYSSSSLVGFNVLFDVSFVENELKRAQRNEEFRSLPLIDIRGSALGRGRTLSSMARAMGIAIPQTLHRAGPDVLATKRIAERLLAHLSTCRMDR